MSVLYARIRDDIHDELRVVAELAGVSMTTVTEIILSWRLGIETGPIGHAVSKALLTRKRARQ
jgi:hypothetical protein